MTRLTAIVTVAAVSAALATAAAGTGMLPASAAARQPAHSASRPAARQVARGLPGGRMSKPVPADPVRIVSQYGDGQYVSVVTCQGVQVPPPLHLRWKKIPLELVGTKPSAAVIRAMAVPGRYRTVYTCTVVVKKEAPASPGKGGGIKPCESVRTSTGTCVVTLNTGFGGAAGSVSGHRPMR